MKIRELPCGHRAHDVVSVDVRRGHKVGSQLCARQFNQGQARGNMFGETPEQVLIGSLISTAASEVLGNFDTGHQRSVHAHWDK